jgi:hypothetical protein
MRVLLCTKPIKYAHLQAPCTVQVWLHARTVVQTADQVCSSAGALQVERVVPHLDGCANCCPAADAAEEALLRGKARGHGNGVVTGHLQQHSTGGNSAANSADQAAAPCLHHH